MPIVKKGASYVRIQMHIQDQPRYVETLLYGKLERKLRREYGIAPEPLKIKPVLEADNSKSELPKDKSEKGSVKEDDSNGNNQQDKEKN
jgi:hypothetical protein